MIKSTNRLALKTETLRTLSSDALDAVLGGIAANETAKQSVGTIRTGQTINPPPRTTAVTKTAETVTLR